MVSGRLKHITFIVHFISIYYDISSTSNHQAFNPGD